MDFTEEIMVYLQRIDICMQQFLAVEKGIARSEDNDLIDLEQAASLLKVSKRTVYTRVNNGTLPASKLGKRWYLSRREVLATIASARRKTDAQIATAVDVLLTPKKNGK